MVSFLQKILFVLMMGGLLLVAYYSVENLERIYLQTTSAFVSFGISLIFTFTMIIISRYLFLMFFAIIQTIHKTADEGVNTRRDDRVSIIVPCYNEGEVIVPSLQGVINQTYPNVEIIVV